MSRELAERRRQFASRLTVVALVWSIGLIVAAIAVPAYGGHTDNTPEGLAVSKVTLVVQKGAWVLIPVAIPALISVIVALTLRRKYVGAGQTYAKVAWAAIAVLAAFALYLILSVGIYLIPVVILLACAARLTPGEAEVRAARPTSDRPRGEQAVTA